MFGISLGIVRHFKFKSLKRGGRRGTRRKSCKLSSAYLRDLCVKGFLLGIFAFGHAAWSAAADLPAPIAAALNQARIPESAVALYVQDVSQPAPALALNAEQVSGVRADRELFVVWAVAKGSVRNKLVLVPAALAISAHYAIVYAWTSPRHQRVLRPVMIGLLIPSLLAGALTIRAWINTTDDYMELRLATYLTEATRPDETIFTNLPFNPNLEYYAYRRLVADVSLSEAEAQAAGAAVYFSCAWVDPEATGVRLDPQQPSEGCTLVRVQS